MINWGPGYKKVRKQTQEQQVVKWEIFRLRKDTQKKHNLFLQVFTKGCHNKKKKKKRVDLLSVSSEPRTRETVQEVVNLIISWGLGSSKLELLTTEKDRFLNDETPCHWKFPDVVKEPFNNPTDVSEVLCWAFIGWKKRWLRPPPSFCVIHSV